MAEIRYHPRFNGLEPYFSVYPSARVFTWCGDSIAEIVGHNGRILVPLTPEPIYLTEIIEALASKDCNPIVLSPDGMGWVAVFGLVVRPSLPPSARDITIRSSVPPRGPSDA